MTIIHNPLSLQLLQGIVYKGKYWEETSAGTKYNIHPVAYIKLLHYDENLDKVWGRPCTKWSPLLNESSMTLDFAHVELTEIPMPISEIPNYPGTASTSPKKKELRILNA